MIRLSIIITKEDHEWIIQRLVKMEFEEVDRINDNQKISKVLEKIFHHGCIIETRDLNHTKEFNILENEQKKVP